MGVVASLRPLCTYRLPLIAASLFALTLSMVPTSAHYRGDANPWGKKRTLCYTLSEDVAKDEKWPGWIKKAAANWNRASKRTGWTFVECPKGQKPDFDFGFHQASVSSQTGTPLPGSKAVMTVKIVKDISKTTVNNVRVDGGYNGWDTKDDNGKKTLDPVLTMMHELTHIMLLDHVGGCSATDFEEPVCPGDHADRQPSLADINQIRFAIDKSPYATVTPPDLPAKRCFATIEEKAAFLKALRAQIDALQAKANEANAELKKLGPPPGGANELAVWAPQNASLRFEVEQNSINANTLEVRYGEAEALGICGHSMRIVTPTPGSPIVTPAPGTALASVTFEAGGINVGDASHTATCSACPARPGQSAGSDDGFTGLDFRLNLAGLAAVMPRGGVRFTDNFVMTSPFVGFRVRRYFDQQGREVGFDFHPTAGTDTFLSYSVLWSYKTYIGMQFIWDHPFGAQLVALGIAPYVGVNFERGRTRLRSDESGGGGVANTFDSVTTRRGTAVGVDLDWYFRNLPFFVGLGLQWDFMPEVSMSGVSAINNFSYHGQVAGRTDFTAAARLGVLIGGDGAVVASDMRLKRNIARVGELESGLALYRYRYLWDDQVYVGVMAQDVASVMPEAIVRGNDGYLRVNYARLGTTLKTWQQWSAERGTH